MYCTFFRRRLTKLSVAFLSALAAIPFADALTFDTPHFQAAGTGPYQLVIGDFNKDSHQDVAVVNVGVWSSGNGSLSIFLGNGDDTLQPQDNYPTGIISTGITKGDINGDGWLDIIVVNRYPYGPHGDLTVFLNKADGTGDFVHHATIPSGRQPMHAAVGHLNEDSYPDIAVAVHGDDSVQILFGDGTGAFTESLPRIPIGNGPNGIAIARIDGDSIDDIVVSNWWSYDVSVLLGDGYGAFVEKFPRAAIGRRAWTLVTADLNGDGITDVVAPNSYDRDISVLLGRNDGTFLAMPKMPALFASYEVTIADVDLDGKLDLLSGYYGVGAGIFLGNGDGTFQTPALAFPSNAFPNVTAADMNGDGCPDLVSTEYYINSVAVFIQTPINLPPIADAGPDISVREGDTVYLDGRASSDENTPLAELRFSWGFSMFPGVSAPPLMGADTAMPSFVASEFGTYMLTLTVTDSKGLSDMDFTLVSSENLPPTALATAIPDLLILGETSTLDGSASTDPEEDPIDYQWMLTAAPNGSAAVILSSDTVKASITPDLEGLYEITLTVRDFLGPGIPVSISVIATNFEEYTKIQIMRVLDDLRLIVDANPDTDLSDKAEDVFDKIASILDELDKLPPDRPAAMGNFEGALGDLEAAVDDGLFTPEQEGIELLEALATIARNVACDAIIEATDNNGDLDELSDARLALSQGDGNLESKDYKGAVNKYKDALSKAEGSW